MTDRLKIFKMLMPAEFVLFDYSMWSNWPSVWWLVSASLTNSTGNPR